MEVRHAGAERDRRQAGAGVGEGAKDRAIAVAHGAGAVDGFQEPPGLGGTDLGRLPVQGAPGRSLDGVEGIEKDRMAGHQEVEELASLVTRTAGAARKKGVRVRERGKRGLSEESTPKRLNGRVTMYVRGLTLAKVAGEPMVVFWRLEDLGAALAVAEDTGLEGYGVGWIAQGGGG